MSTARVSRPPSVSLGADIQSNMLAALPQIGHSAPESRPVSVAVICAPPSASLGNAGPVSDRPMIRNAGEIPFRVSKSAANTPRLGASDFKLPPITQGAPVVSQSGNRPSIPVLGQKPDFTPRAETARSNVSVSSSVPDYQSKLKLEVDELENCVKKKVNDNFYVVRSAFMTADVEGTGSVTRDICHRVLMTVMGRTIPLKHFNHLLVRAGLGEKSIIGYAQFYSAFRDSTATEGVPQIFETQHKHFASDKNYLTSTQANAFLKAKARKKMLNIADIIPKFQISDDPNDKGRVLKPELFFALQGNGVFMTDAEFDKLWAKFDTQNLGVVDAKVLVNKLGVRMVENAGEDDKDSIQPGKESNTTSKRPKLAHDIERILKGRLQKSHLQVRDAFANFDENNCGKISKDDFLKALHALNIDVTFNTLKELMTRIGLNSDFEQISYDLFLEKVQEFKNQPLHTKFLNHEKNDELSQNITVVEGKLKQLFQPHLLHLLDAFDKADRLHLMTLSVRQFKEVLETELGITISDSDMETLRERIDLDEDGNVLYVNFLEKFNLKNISSILEEEEAPQESDAWDEFEKGRPIKELIRQIKLMFRDHFYDIESFYKENIDWNTDTGRFNQAQFHKLLNTFIVPEVTPGEVRSLWRTFHLNQDKTLNYQNFLQHFLYNKNTAAFPSQRVKPPQIGDSDLIRRSNKVNSSRDIVLNLLNGKINVFWNQIRGEMKYLDPHNTGFVSQLQFKNVLSELQIELDPYELNLLTDKFDTTRDGRINYIDFLKPWAGKTQLGNVAEVFHEREREPADDTDQVVNKMTNMTDRLRSRLTGDVKNLRKAFRKIDDSKSGYLSVSEFRSVLELCNVVLDEEEAFQLAARYDDQLQGKLKYDNFIKDLSKSKPTEKDNMS